MRNDSSRHWTMLTANVAGGALTEAARAVEAAGLAGIACPQIFGSPFVPLSHCAAVTSRVGLQTAVLPAFARSPFETATTAMDLDRLSGGRLVLGVGPSYREWHENWFGMADWGHPVEHLRETIDVIRLVVADAHLGTLDRYQGKYHRHDWSAFLGTAAPPVRTEIPIWISANRLGLVGLAGEVADGMMNHLMWSVHWTLRRGLPALNEALARAGRDRSAFHWQAGYWVAVNPDRAEALEDARTTVALYAGVAQFEPYFAAHGFSTEARACQAAMAAKDVAGAAGLVTDEMAETFVILGTADDCRARIAEVWDLADSFLLIPLIWGMPPEKTAFYANGIAETFYA